MPQDGYNSRESDIHGESLLAELKSAGASASWDC